LLSIWFYAWVARFGFSSVSARLEGYAKGVSLNLAMLQGSMILLCRVCIGDKRERIVLAEAVTLRQDGTRP
jgi:hypothetical protein